MQISNYVLTKTSGYLACDNAVNGNDTVNTCTDRTFVTYFSLG